MISDGSSTQTASTSGEGHYDFGARIYDPRLGRWLSLDPLMAKYPHNSPYAFSENRVADSRELEGLERIGSTSYNVESNDSFERIDKKLGYTPGTMQIFNPGIDPLKLEVGSTLVTPKVSGPWRDAGGTYKETVSTGYGTSDYSQNGVIESRVCFFRTNTYYHREELKNDNGSGAFVEFNATGFGGNYLGSNYVIFPSNPNYGPNGDFSGFEAYAGENVRIGYATAGRYDGELALNIGVHAISASTNAMLQNPTLGYIKASISGTSGSYHFNGASAVELNTSKEYIQYKGVIGFGWKIGGKVSLDGQIRYGWLTDYLEHLYGE
jgi:RHS repeat-associated protein